MIDLSVSLGEKFKLSNPVLTASGTFGYGDEIADLLDINCFGGIVTKSLSLKPREGNPPPRIVETASGMINSIGLANIGLDRFIAEKAEFLQSLSCKVIVNIAGREENEYGEVLRRLTDFAWIDGFEINVSCPNVKEGGIEFGVDRTVLGRLVRKLRDLTDKFLIVKLSPNVTDIRPLAETVQAQRGDAVSMINTLYGCAIDIYTRRPLINSVIGGLSGPAIKPVALAHIIKTSKVIDIPIIGIGGIRNGADVVEFLLAGAAAVHLGTVNFFNPTALNGILEFLQDYCRQQKIKALRELVGKVQL